MAMDPGTDNNRNKALRASLPGSSRSVFRACRPLVTQGAAASFFQVPALISRRAFSGSTPAVAFPAESSPESYRRRLTCRTAPLRVSRRTASVKLRAESGKNMRQARL